MVLLQIAGDFVRLPSGKGLREASVRHFDIGPLHNFLKKGWSEPGWVRYVRNYSESEPT